MVDGWEGVISLSEGGDAEVNEEGFDIRERNKGVGVGNRAVVEEETGFEGAGRPRTAVTCREGEGERFRDETSGERKVQIGS